MFAHISFQDQPWSGGELCQLLQADTAEGKHHINILVSEMKWLKTTKTPKNPQHQWVYHQLCVTATADGVATPLCVSLTPPITPEDALLFYYSALLFLSFEEAYHSCRYAFV